MLSIHIGSITEAGLEIEDRIDASALPILGKLARESALRFNQPLNVRIRATSSGESILIDGTATTVLILPCSRCVKPFELTLHTDFATTAMPELAIQAPVGGEDEIELNSAEMDVITYAGNSIDLREEVAQQIIMAIPFYPVCTPACKGLCSHCGADLNETACSCSDADSANPFAALKVLSFPTKQD
jgi:uncharacterized protein